ncbi:MAG: undecaprenyl-diphosphate phosphatase [Actinobacteria bacterium]|nr:undecaprenyl-diphosphate phosphatase [Actinomycetota bacterium]
MWLEAIVLAVVQAVTEFLPISSSGHLLVIPAVLGWSDGYATSLTLSVALHVGTALALVAALWRDWLWLVRGVLGRGTHAAVARRLMASIALATVAVGAAAWPLKDVFEDARYAWVSAAMLMGFGALLAIADRLGATRWALDTASWRAWMLVGLSQFLALVPGVSRSGITLTAGRALGIERQATARFSFLASTPLVLAVGAVQLGGAVRSGATGDQAGPLLAGTAVAAVVGVAVIRWLLAFVASHGLWIFAAYRIAFGTAVLAFLAVRGSA